MNSNEPTREERKAEVMAAVAATVAIVVVVWLAWLVVTLAAGPP